MSEWKEHNPKFGQPNETINKYVQVRFESDGHETGTIWAGDVDWEFPRDQVSHYRVIAKTLNKARM